MSGVVFVVVLLFLRVKTPEGTLQSKVAAIDWMYACFTSGKKRLTDFVLLSGNFIIIAGIVLTNIALSWAGVEHSWGDPHVVVTLVLGLVLIVAFVLYETFLPPAKPVMPWSIINNRTSAGAFIGTFLYGLVMMSIICQFFLSCFCGLSLTLSQIACRCTSKLFSKPPHFGRVWSSCHLPFPSHSLQL